MPQGSLNDRKEQLIERLVTYVQDHGVSDFSLRPVAEALGTSPRMLLYHFGSRSQLLVDVLYRYRRVQTAVVEEWAAEEQLPGVVRLYWRWASQPQHETYLRLFFEVAGLAVQRRPGTEDTLPSIISDSMDLFVPPLVDAGCDPEFAREQVGLAIGAVRGLFLDLLVTGERERLQHSIDTLADDIEARIARHITERTAR